jgi:hypothetical protein
MLRTATCLLVLIPGLARAQDVEQGHLLATRWCANDLVAYIFSLRQK